MTTVKVAAKHWDRQSAIFFGMGMVWMGLMALAIPHIDDIRLQQALGLVTFIAFVVAVFALMNKQEKAFKCPDCGGPVGASLDTDGKPNTPILRLCPRCDILWQTGATPD